MKLKPRFPATNLAMELLPQPAGPHNTIMYRSSVFEVSSYLELDERGVTSDGF